MAKMQKFRIYFADFYRKKNLEVHSGTFVFHLESKCTRMNLQIFFSIKIGKIDPKFLYFIHFLCNFCWRKQKNSASILLIFVQKKSGCSFWYICFPNKRLMYHNKPPEFFCIKISKIDP